MSAVYEIDNPGSQINNPASKMYNPATKENNPASNIYNPASQMKNRNPISPVTPPAPQPADSKLTSPATKNTQHPQARPAMPRKSYHYKTVQQYIAAAKTAFIDDDYLEFIMITEDALGRIKVGTLKASKKEKEKLEKYQAFGHGLVEKSK
jgi:hypothetical protein